MNTPKLTCGLCGSECENVRLIKRDVGDSATWIGQCPDCEITVTQVSADKGD